MIALFESIVESGIIEELAQSEGKTVGAWIKDLKNSEQTVGQWYDDHPKFQFLLQDKIEQLKNAPIKLLLQSPDLKPFLLKLENSNLDLGSRVKLITAWKIELDYVKDPNDVRWVCCQIAISAFLTIPLIYISREIVSILLGRKIEISHFSAVKYTVLTEIVHTVLTQIAISK